MAFENCKNCDAKIDCGCQYQVAIDGTSCCDDCVGAYNFMLQSKVNETKKIKKKNDEQSNSKLFDGSNEKNGDEQSEIL